METEETILEDHKHNIESNVNLSISNNSIDLGRIDFK